MIEVEVAERKRKRSRSLSGPGSIVALTIFGSRVKVSIDYPTVYINFDIPA